MIFIDRNNKYIDESGVVHIFITTKKGQEFEALYSGDNVEDVMRATWCVSLRKWGKVDKVVSNNYIKGKMTKLHQVDLGSWVVHINNNPLDNRMENLEKSNYSKIGKNMNRKGKYELVGMCKSSKGWYSKFYVDSLNVYTDIKESYEEARIDNIICQKHLKFKHNEDLFYILDDISKDRIFNVVDFINNQINNNKSVVLNVKTYNHDIRIEDGCKILNWNNKKMLFDSDIDISNMYIYKNSGYWSCRFVENNKKINNRFHKEILGFRPHAYSEYGLHVDHINNNPDDNRAENIIITTTMGNLYNKQGIGYYKTAESQGYIVMYMMNYRFWDELITGNREPMYYTIREAEIEVERRKKIIHNARVKLKSIKELDILIEYCFNNGYILQNGLADLDLGYLYWKEILV